MKVINNYIDMYKNNWKFFLFFVLYLGIAFMKIMSIENYIIRMVMGISYSIIAFCIFGIIEKKWNKNII